jgi:ABC-type uncharacterized transport system involved in gliding motility auxiliary subunit
MDAKIRLNLRMQLLTTGVLVAVLVGLLAYASHRYPLHWDWTANQRHTLAEQSTKAIKHFDALTATVYVQENSDLRKQAEDLLTRYKVANSAMEIRFVDPDLDPTAVRREEVAVYGTVVLRAGEKSEKVTELTEQSLTNALVRLARGTETTIGFVTGHGEHAIDDQERLGYGDAVVLLKGEGYKVEPITLAEVEHVPDTLKILVLAGPRKALLPLEVERLKTWYEKDKKGRLLVMMDPDTRSGLESWLTEHGITVLNGLVIDPVARLFGTTPTTPLISKYDPEHPITKGFSVVTFFPEARGLELAPPAPGDSGGKRTDLLYGAERGWLETAPIKNGEVSFEEGSDQRGPVLLGATLEEAQQRLIVLGDSDFAANTYVKTSGNGDLFLNMVRWLAEDEAFIAIKPKAVQDAGLVLTPMGTFLIRWGMVVLLPMLLVGMGIGIWIRRKRR